MSNAQQETAQQAVARVLAAQTARDAEQQALLQKLRDDAAELAAAKEKERAAEEAAKVERLQKERAARFDRENKPGLLAAWRANGGDTASFEAAWPALRAQLLQDAARRTHEQARASMAALYRDF
jgi:hypothetical protein